MGFINTWTDLTCPDDCTDVLLLPALGSDPDCFVVPPLSQANYIFLTPTGAPQPFTWSGSTVTAVANAVDNTNADNTKTRKLAIIGNLAEPEIQEITLPNLVRLITKRSYAFNFRAPISDDATYNFWRRFECNYLKFTFHFSTLGKKLYGDTNGIKPVFANIRFPKNEDATAFEEVVGTITFETDNGDPRRGNNPLA